MIRAGGLGDREKRGMAYQKPESDLMGCRMMLVGDFFQHLSRACTWPGKVSAAERAVGDNGDPVARTPGYDRVFDGSFLEMIQHLIASEIAAARERAYL